MLNSHVFLVSVFSGSNHSIIDKTLDQHEREKAFDSPDSHHDLVIDSMNFSGTKYSKVSQDVKNCLTLYQKLRHQVDEDTAAMVLKCCLCYGDCLRKKWNQTLCGWQRRLIGRKNNWSGTEFVLSGIDFFSLFIDSLFTFYLTWKHKMNELIRRN